MTVARSSILPESGAGVFHCISRCVRRSWLCGVDPYNGKDYSHRKQWVRDRLEELAGIYAIEVYAYAVMSNHLHVVMRVDPRRVEKWSDREVVMRWRRLFPAGRDAWGRALEPTSGNGGQCASVDKIQTPVPQLSCEEHGHPLFESPDRVYALGNESVR